MKRDQDFYYWAGQLFAILLVTSILFLLLAGLFYSVKLFFWVTYL